MGENVKKNPYALSNRKKESKESETSGSPSMMGNPAVVTAITPGDAMRERQIMEPNMEDVADYGSTREQATSELSKESKEYNSSRGYYHGGEVCKGGGKAIRGLGFKGTR